MLRYSFILSIFVLLSNSELAFASECGDTLLDCDEGAVAPESFVPNLGTVSAYDTAEGRFVFVGFKWTSSSYLQWYKDGPWRTLEPDVLFHGTPPYTDNFYPPFQANAGGLPGQSTAVKIVYLSGAYGDATFADDPPNITVGSSNAAGLYENKWYYSLSSVTNRAIVGEMTVRIQRGQWGSKPAFDAWWNPLHDFCFEQDVPIWVLAPVCVYSCCANRADQVNNFPIIKESYPGTAPGCYDWSFPGSTLGEATVNRCQENLCSDEIDNDYDGLTDSQDPDCGSSSDPCSSVTSGSGYYCGGNSEMPDGNPGELYFCVGPSSASPPPGCPPVGPCPGDCVPNDPGEHSCCDGNCNGFPCAPDTYICSGNDRQICGSDSCSWDHVETCSCGCLDGVCATSLCSAGEVRCNGGNEEVCSSDGCSWLLQQACSCSCSGSSCVSQLCASGQTQCSSSSDVDACAADGCSFQFSHTCPAGEVCQNGVCVNAPCTTTTYWSPNEISATRIVGTTTLEFFLRGRPNDTGVDVQVCKIGGNIAESLRVEYNNQMLPLLGTGFGGTLASAGQCTVAGQLNFNITPQEGHQLGGTARVVSPFNCATEWTSSCSPAPGFPSPCGTCWYWVDVGGVMEGTCKIP